MDDAKYVICRLHWPSFLFSSSTHRIENVMYMKLCRNCNSYSSALTFDSWKQANSHICGTQNIIIKLHYHGMQWVKRSTFPWMTLHTLSLLHMHESGLFLYFSLLMFSLLLWIWSIFIYLKMHDLQKWSTLRCFPYTS